MKVALLVILFFITAILYASIGFGGGSTYTAFLILFQTDYRLVPIIALICNIIVVSGNSLRYQKEKLIAWPRLWPILIVSVPAAWIGGQINISETLFIGLLWIALLLAGTRLLFNFDSAPLIKPNSKVNKILAINIGGSIGFYAGLVGIGGGIFLAPILHMIKWGSTKTIAASCSVFILVNSTAGLFGQFIKLRDTDILPHALNYWPLIPAIFIGGFIGNHLGVYRMADIWLKRLTAVLIIFVALRLMIKWISLMT